MEPSTPVDVPVPLLDAYTLNKAATFLKRTPAAMEAGSRSNPKRAKDLLYLRDLVHGGPEVVGAIERDIATIVEHDRDVQHVVVVAAATGWAGRATHRRPGEVGDVAIGMPCPKTAAAAAD